MTHEDFKARMEQLNDEVLGYSEDLARSFEKEIDKAILSLEKDLEYWFARLAKNNQTSLAEARKILRGKALKEFQWTVEEYIRHGEENGISADWRKELENASARVHISWIESAEIQLKNLAEMLREESQQTATQAMSKVYEEGYWRTAFEIEKALKIGVDLPRVDAEIIKQKILHPWTADGDSYMKRITTNTVKLEQRVNTELTQMLMRGDPPRKAIDTIAEEFHVAKRHAARLIMTESAAMASLASKEVYKDLNVDRYEILVTLDEITCPKCRPLDGKIFDRTAYRVGVTANPFHPSCRCTTVPYYEDFTEGSTRAARDENGKTFELPASVKYEDFRKMMEDRQKRVDKSYTSKTNQNKENSTTIKEKYKDFLTSVPEKNKILLEQSFDAVSFKKIKVDDITYGYKSTNDTLYYNPDAPAFLDLDSNMALTHELAHRIDNFFVNAYMNKAFSKAVSDAYNVIKANPQKFIDYSDENDKEGFLSDILDAISEGKYKFKYFHEKAYWKTQGKKEKEIFANLFTLESYVDEEKIKFIKENFSDVWEVYKEMTADL